MVIRLTCVCLFTFSAFGFGANPVASASFIGGEQGRIQVHVKVNQQGPFLFLFDTGSLNVISLDLARKLGIKISGHSTVQAFGGRIETASALVDSMNVGDLTMEGTKAVIITGGPFREGGLVGMLGREFLEKLVTEVDYEHGTLKFFDPETFIYAGRGARVPVTLQDNGAISIPAQIFDVDANIQVDSGNGTSLVLFPRFVRKHGLNSKLEAITGYGYGGLTRAMVTRAPLLKIGAFDIRNPVVQLSMNTHGIAEGSVDGNIGGSLLREFTCIYDLSHRLLYLEPNTWYGKPELTDNSGLVLDSRGKSARVLFVYPGSPAAEAGIVAGDELKDSNEHDLIGDQWHDLLDAAPGSNVCVTVLHKARVTRKCFVLKSYL